MKKSLFGGKNTDEYGSCQKNELSLLRNQISLLKQNANESYKVTVCACLKIQVDKAYHKVADHVWKYRQTDPTNY